MEALEASCQDAVSYPCNLIDADFPSLFLAERRQELLNQSSRLFCADSAASVDFLEVQRIGKESSLRFARNRDDVQKFLGQAIVQQLPDPACRFIFIYAPSSRDRLNITLAMLQQIFSYHQVMLPFMESLFSFGYRVHAEECSVTSFSSRNYLPGQKRGLEVTQLGRSGECIQHCYGLRSVEHSDSQVDWPWSIRLCSTYHSFDLVSGQATWIVVKANRLIEKLVRDTMASESYREQSRSRGDQFSFAASLLVHELVATWSANNWQYYIDFLERNFQEMTREALSVTLRESDTTVPGDGVAEDPIGGLLSREPTELGDIEKGPMRERTPSTLQKFSRRVRTMTSIKSNSTVQAKSPPRIKVSNRRFAFEDLPRIHDLEESANEAADVLANNIAVLEALKKDYSEVLPYVRARFTSQDVDQAYVHFVERIESVQRSMQTQRSRLAQFLRLLNNRKALVQGILEYEAMKANRDLAEKANISAKNMEYIAVKTKLETVSMRIITLVTLFFLPGTFISTLMSTPIVTFAPGSPSTSDSNISTGALGFYCAVSLPLVVFTFATWGLVYWWETRAEKKRQLEAQGTSPKPTEQ